MLLTVGLSMTACAESPGRDGSAAASIRGVVRVSGERPKPREISVISDPEAAKIISGGKLKLIPAEVDEQGGLKGALVFIVDGVKDSFPVPREAAVLRISGCRFVPPVLAIRAGQDLSVKNDDPLKHYPHAKDNPRVEVPVSQPEVVERMVFKDPYSIELVRCYLHGWERAWVAALPHPYFASTAADGSFELPSLPEGKYRLKAWHPEYEPTELDFHPGKRVEFSLVPKPSK